MDSGLALAGSVVVTHLRRSSPVSSIPLASVVETRRQVDAFQVTQLCV